MPVIDPTVLAAARKGFVRPTFFLRVASTPTKLRLCTARGNRLLATDTVEDNADEDNQYLGIGALQNLPVLDALVNCQAQRTEFAVAGVNDEFVAHASEEAPGIRGARANFGVLFLDEHHQAIGNIWWARQGRADGVRIERRYGVRVVVLSIGWGLTSRRRPALAFFTNQDQHKRSADDRFCERTPLYENKTRKWPRWKN